MPSSNFERMKRQRSGRVYHVVLGRFTTAPELAEFVYSLCIRYQRYERTAQSSDVRECEFHSEQHSLSLHFLVAAMADPLKVVTDREINLTRPVASRG